MKKLLTIFLFFACLTLQATTHYISPTGSNSNAGTIGSPWLTLQYACSQVSTVGDIIHVNAGTYTGSTQCVLAPGVSIEGEGITSHLISHFNSDEYSFYIDAESNSNTNGNQHISGLYIDGGTYQGYIAIAVCARNNVSIYNCTIKRFYAGAIVLCGEGNYGPPSVYATGLVIHDCRLIDDATCEGGGTQLYGILAVGGTKDFQCYNTTIHQINRGANISGECLKMYNGGFVYGSHYYNDTIMTDPLPGSMFSGAAEFFACLGGIEMNNSVIQGTLDFSCPLPTEIPSFTSDISMQDVGDQVGGKYGFSLKIHDNQMLYTVYRNADESEIDIERNVPAGGVYIYKNYFSNVYYPIQFSYDNGGSTGTHYTKQDIYIYYNIFYNLGSPGGALAGSGINIEAGTLGGTNDIIQNLNIVNNVFVAGSLATPDAAITGYANGKWINTIIRNNIIEGFPYPLYLPGSGVIQTMSMENNIFYSNTHNSNYYGSFSISGKTEQNTLTTDPQFVGGSPYDYHLSSTSSPAYHSGIALSMPVSYTDYAGIAVTNPPERGVYEYVSGASAPTVTTTAVTSITTISAISGGNVTADGGTIVTARGVCWNTSTNPTTANSHTSDGTGTGVFTSSLTGLAASTVYYVRAYATNSSGTAYGSVVQFTAASNATVPTLTTTTVTNVTGTNAQSGGTITSNGGATITAAGICWSTSTTPTLANAHTNDYYGSSPYISYFGGLLTPGVTYYVRAYATNSSGTGYGNQLTVPTPATTLYKIKSGTKIITVNQGGLKNITVNQ